MNQSFRIFKKPSWGCYEPGVGTICERVKEAVEDYKRETGKTNADLAFGMRCSERYLLGMLNGESPWKDVWLESLANAMDTDVTALLMDKVYRADYRNVFSLIESGKGEMLLKAVGLLDMAVQAAADSEEEAELPPRKGPGIRRRKRSGGG